MGTPWVSFDGKDCSGCKHLNERGYCEFTGCIIPCMLRATIPEVKLQTNADRIRAMTDEELAEFFPTTASEFSCPPGSTNESCRNAGGWFNGCPKCWLDWLRHEVEDERT